jgi:hypothetical protein
VQYTVVIGRISGGVGVLTGLFAMIFPLVGLVGELSSALQRTDSTPLMVSLIGLIIGFSLMAIMGAQLVGRYPILSTLTFFVSPVGIFISVLLLPPDPERWVTVFHLPLIAVPLLLTAAISSVLRNETRAALREDNRSAAIGAGAYDLRVGTVIAILATLLLPFAVAGRLLATTILIGSVGALIGYVIANVVLGPRSLSRQVKIAGVFVWLLCLAVWVGLFSFLGWQDTVYVYFVLGLLFGLGGRVLRTY